MFFIGCKLFMNLLLKNRANIITLLLIRIAGGRTFGKRLAFDKVIVIMLI